MWEKEQEESFRCLKASLVSTPVLSNAYYEKTFVVETDASPIAIRAVLVEKKKDGKIQPVQLSSRRMKQAERNFLACKGDALTVIFSIRKFRLYLLSCRRF